MGFDLRFIFNLSHRFTAFKRRYLPVTAFRGQKLKVNSLDSRYLEELRSPLGVASRSRSSASGERYYVFINAEKRGFTKGQPFPAQIRRETCRLTACCGHRFSHQEVGVISVRNLLWGHLSCPRGAGQLLRPVALCFGAGNR